MEENRTSFTGQESASPEIGLSVEAAQLLEDIRGLAGELHEIKGSRSYRAVTRVKRSRLGGAVQFGLRLVWPTEGGWVRALRSRPRNLKITAAPNDIHILPTGRHHPASQGSEVWLLAVNPDQAGRFDWKQVKHSTQWTLKSGMVTPSGQCLVSAGSGQAYVPGTPTTQLAFLAHPWSGLVTIKWDTQQLDVDLYSATGEVVLVDLSTGKVRHTPSLSVTAASAAPDTPYLMTKPVAFSRADRAWLETQSAQPRPVSVGHPQWRGIRSSASQLFDVLYEIDDTLDEPRGLYYARLFAEAACPAVVIQGFPLSYRFLVSALKRIAPQIPVYVIWHGNFTHTIEDYSWTAFRTVENLCRERQIAKWGFVKKGMAEIMAQRGLHTGFVMNRVRDIPIAPSTPLPDGPHLGLWSIYAYWRKLPYEPLAASLLLDRAVVHTSGMDKRVAEFVKVMGINADIRTQAIAQDRMSQMLAQMHLNLYVTLNDCAPMLPLESLAAGVPCLMGTSAYYFEDHDYLHSRLVVRSPDTASVIAQYARQALEERAEIIQAYREFAPGYNARVQNQLQQFLEIPSAARA